MDQISTSLQKAIQDNYKKLNLLGMASTPEVLCNCTVFKPSGVMSSTSVPTVTAPPAETIPSQFIPGETNDGTFLVVDPGNIPFILPKGVTPDDIIMEQAAALKPLVEAAEESNVVATTIPGEATATTILSLEGQSSSVPTTTVVEGVVTEVQVSSAAPTTVVAGSPTSLEHFAAFQYDDVYARVPSMNVPSYRDTLVRDSPRCQYLRGARDMYTLSLSSWLLYITLFVAYYWFFMR